MATQSTKKLPDIRFEKMIGFVITTRPEDAKVFYERKLGFRFRQDDGFALVFDAHGSMLRVTKVKDFTPAAFTVLGWEVKDILAAVKALRAKGVVFERYPGMPQDENAICSFGEDARVAWFKDPNGNVLSLSQHL
jgi:catechol 2,3-dioxygenase-like lactoylglutathione lyase family enzyme